MPMAENPENRQYWYALRVTYGREMLVKGYLDGIGVESYIPCEIVTVEVRGVRKQVRRTVIPSLMFFRATEEYAKDLQTTLRGRVMLYTYVNEKWKKVPSLISEYEMDMFRLVTSSGAAGLDYFGGDSIVYGIGDRVRVTGGVFKGAEGYIKRIKGRRRLIVSITGICAVATSFIPNCFLQKIEEVV